jgi:hypothetical protein
VQKTHILVSIIKNIFPKQEILLKRQALDAFKETVEVFEEQLNLQESYQRHAAANEMLKYVENTPNSLNKK